ncbi:hypothetical protein [Fulvivirga ligni]|uniref:hypothetical protein n=1 Tax=Fulvivirga ligni TaxID=2904246 RepID=UPI001F487C08|nr:hypothetical protein [Fulvivirga ligni]UII20664.1 hypothetical protein LVD16_22750 [Fulvivirga ligni]
MDKLPDPVNHKGEVLEILGILLGLAMIGFYQYLYPISISTNENNWREVELTSKPEYSERGEDDALFITFRAKGIPSDLIITGCSFNLAIKEKLLNLNTGSIATLQLSKKKNVIFPFSDDLYVYGLIIENEELLTPAIYNTCEKRAWTKPIFYLIIFCVMFLPFLFNHINRIISKRNAH